MSHGELRTHLWNLSFGVTASLTIAACGPSVILEGDTDTDTASATDTDPTETDTTSGLSFVRGANDGQPSFACRSPYAVGDPLTSFSYEVGDFDGNGRADVVIESDGLVTIMLTQ